MGIQGLIPFLKNASRPVNIRNFSGCTVAVDAYCWLHKGAFSCAEKLGKGEKPDGYVHYCIKMVNSLIAAGVQPILVFDGKHLPSKAITEQKRHEKRHLYKKKAKEFLRQGKLKEARECFQRCTEVTSDMALEVIQACRKLGVDCIVAPYEADAQLAYFNKIGIAQVIITEDSDLVLFGCERIIFKLDIAGNGILVESCKLHLCLGLKAESFTFEKFRYMCIMSGCDYLPSLPGIGLAKASKFFSKTTNPNLNMVLPKIPMYLNMSNVTISKDYIESFDKANKTFLYQLVFDPLKRKLVPLNAYPSDLNSDELGFAGPVMSNEVAFQIALGNISLETMKKVDNFNPDKDKLMIKSSSWTSKAILKKSIWDPAYKIEPVTTIEKSCAKNSNTTTTSQNPSPVMSTAPKNFIIVKHSLKRSLSDSKLDDELPTNEDLLKMYGDGDNPNQSKKLKIQVDKDFSLENSIKLNNNSPEVVVLSRFFASVTKTVLPETESNHLSSSVRKSTDNCSDANAYFLQTKSINQQLDQIQVEDNERENLMSQKGKMPDQTPPVQRRGSLFFDRAISSQTAVTALSPSSPLHKRTCLSSTPLQQKRNFGDWNCLRTFFSYPSIDAIAKSPRTHTEFKPVKASVSVSHSSVIEMEEETPSQESDGCQSPVSLSESSFLNCSQTSGSQVNSINSESFQWSQSTEISNESSYPVDSKDNEENSFDELNSSRSPSSQSSRVLFPISSNTVDSISRVSKSHNIKPLSVPGRCKRVGLSKSKPLHTQPSVGTKPSSVSQTLAKFGFTKTRTQFSMAS